MSANVGLDIRRGVANGLILANAPSIDSVGILFKRKRGVKGKVVLMESPDNDLAVFGDSATGMYGAEFVRDFFLNATPAAPKLYASRLVASDAVAGSVVVSDSDVNANASITLKGGQYGEEDPGDWINNYKPIIYAVYTEDGSAVDYWQWKLMNPDSELVESATFPTWADMVSWLTDQSAYVTVSASVAPSTIPQATLVSVADLVNGGAAIPGDTAMLNINLTTLYKAYTLRFRFDYTMMGLTETSTVQEATQAFTALFPPGTDLYWNNGSSDLLVGKINPLQNVWVGGSFSAGKHVFDVRIGNGADDVTISSNIGAMYSAGSSSIDETKLKTFGSVVISAPSDVFSSGADGTATEDDAYANNESGLSNFDEITDLSVVSVLDFFSNTMYAQGKSYAYSRGDVVYVQSLPYIFNRNMASAFSAINRDNLINYASAYWAWTKVYSKAEGGYAWTPGLAWILGGGFVRVPYNNGELPHFPPAGVESAVVGAIDVWPSALSQADINAYVQEHGINVPRKTYGTGFYLASSRTTSSDPLYHSIHIIRQSIFYAKTFDNSLSWSTQKPITTDLVNRLIGWLNDYGKTQYELGGLEQSIPFSEAWQVQRLPNADRKILDIEIRYIPVECSESVVIRLNRNDGILTTTVNS